MPYKTNMTLTKEQITKLCSKHFPKKDLVLITEIKESFVNPVFELSFSTNERFILKVNNPHWPFKQKREVFAMNLIERRTSIPLPDVFSANYEKEIIPYDYLLLKKIEGLTLHDCLQKDLLSDFQYLEIIQQLGNYMGEYHSITFDHFGDFTQKSENALSKEEFPSSNFWGVTFATWKEAFIGFCFDNLSWVDSESFPKYRSKLPSLINHFAKKISKPEKGCFVHSDLQPTNILINEGKISAIIDFEWAFSGSANFDFALTLSGLFYSSFPSLEKNTGKFNKITSEIIADKLTKGYQETIPRKIIKEPKNLIDFIWLLYMIGSWSWIKKSSTEEEIKEHRKMIKDVYKRILNEEGLNLKVK